MQRLLYKGCLLQAEGGRIKIRVIPAAGHDLGAVLQDGDGVLKVIRKKEKWKPYLDYVLKEQEWLKEHQEQELKEIKSKDGLTLRAAYIQREDLKDCIDRRITDRNRFAVIIYPHIHIRIFDKELNRIIHIFCCQTKQ